MITVEYDHKKIIRDILGQYPYEFYVFGSRAKGTCRPNSDLDLLYIEEIPGYIVTDIEEAFTESDLPFKVDLVGNQHCSKEFYESIRGNLILFE